MGTQNVTKLSVGTSMMTAATLVASLVHAQSLPPGAHADTGRLARIDSIFAPYARLDRPGYAVGILQRGRLIYARGFGSANLDHAVPITPASVFNVASLAKQFTAACIGILIRRGQLSLEDPVSRFVPEFSRYSDTIRIKHLVYMTSGLPEYYSLARPGGRNWDLDHFTIEDAIDAVVRHGHLAFAPGTRWAYSNTNYMLLAKIVRRVTNVSLAQYAQREIFRPLGMTASHINDDLGQVVKNRVTGYNRRALGEFQQEIRRSPHFGGSGLFTSVEDLARWNLSFETHQLGGPDLTALLLSTVKFEHGKVNDAFGLVWGTHRGRRTIGYEGGDLGFSSYIVRIPEERLAVIVLSNLGSGRAADHGRAILDVFFARE